MNSAPCERLFINRVSFCVRGLTHAVVVSDARLFFLIETFIHPYKR